MMLGGLTELQWLMMLGGLTELQWLSRDRIDYRTNILWLDF